MDPRVYAEFEAICSRHNIAGDVLEIGALPNDSALLNMESLKGARQKIGLNLVGSSEYKGFRIVAGNANHMPMFHDGAFDLVLCNAVLEHDKFFWRSIAEIKRVTKAGGLIVLAAPGFGDLSILRCLETFRRSSSHSDLCSSTDSESQRFLSRVKSYLFDIAFSTPTLAIHDYPGDYYRFSVQSFTEVILDGLAEIEVRSILLPPRIVGAGVKPPTVQSSNWGNVDAQ